MFIRRSITHFRNYTAFLKSYVKHTMRNHWPGTFYLFYLQLKLKYNKLWQLVLDGGIFVTQVKKSVFILSLWIAEGVVLRFFWTSFPFSFLVTSTDFEKFYTKWKRMQVTATNTSFLGYKLCGCICPHSSEYFPAAEIYFPHSSSVNFRNLVSCSSPHWANETSVKFPGLHSFKLGT